MNRFVSDKMDCGEKLILAEDRIYYTKYSGSMLWNRDLYCYSLANNSFELVDCDVMDFLVLSDELLIAVAKPETNEIVAKQRGFWHDGGLRNPMQRPNV